MCCTLEFSQTNRGLQPRDTVAMLVVNTINLLSKNLNENGF